jgi:hypothetical protein
MGLAPGLGARGKLAVSSGTGALFFRIWVFEVLISHCIVALCSSTS